MLATNEFEARGELLQENRNRIAETLDHILRSPRFKDSQQLQTLLRYIVDESIKGNDDALKERIIGIYVFGRRPDYDTTDDPIVRSRMGLLRKRLGQFYESEDSENTSVHIAIPNGTYRPGFIFRPIPALEAREPRTHAAPSKSGAPALPASKPALTVAVIDAPTPVVTPTSSSTDLKLSQRLEVNSTALLAALVGLLAVAGTWWFAITPQHNQMSALWSPIINGKQPVYVYYRHHARLRTRFAGR